MEVGERQCERHHHQHGPRVEELSPEGDFVALGLLAVLGKVADVLDQIPPGHALRLHQQHTEDVGLQFRAPQVLSQLGHFGPRVGRQCRADGNLRHFGLDDITQFPAHARHKGPVFGRQDRLKTIVAVELEDPPSARADVRRDLPHIDEAVGADTAIGRLDDIAHPDAGAEVAHADLAPGRLQANPLGQLFGGRRHELAQRKRDRHHHQADAGEGLKQAPRAHAGDAHDRELGVGRELRQRVDRPDQRGDRHQLVGARRQGQRYVGKRMSQLEAASADLVELRHQIKEQEQRQQREQHEHGRGRDFHPQVAAQRLHGTTLALRAAG